ncbi:MAG: Gfo/Idh/MocA family oxidoreductase [Pirellulaceae bacterium]|jgi:predicted dehydrogenase|nr:Gfo/Idh/MocA family oxidoreductase [Pirellulaceae bacterium]
MLNNALTNTSRRKFLATSTVAGGSLILAGTRASGQILGANDRVRVAVAGVNSRGKGHLNDLMALPNVEVAWVIDPDQTVLESTMRLVEGQSGGKSKPRGTADVRIALEDKSLDAITVATPHHWHSLITIWAAQAGKHVYVEKPMSHDVGEGRVVVEAQKKYGVVIQHGTQSRSSAKIAGLHAAIHAGKFGRLKIAYGYCCKPRGSIGVEPISEPPAYLDWDLWRGPADIQEFHANYVHYDWHWFWKTGNGDLNNQGTHQLDIARWAIDPDQTHPVRAMAIGGRFLWNDQGETPNTMFAMAEYPNGQQVFFNVRNVNYEGYEKQVENEYYFEDGGRIVRGQYFAKGSSEGETVEVEDGPVTPGGNFGAFITACRAGDPSLANGTAPEAHYSCVLGHLMNNSYRLGEQLPFNKRAGRFGDNADAAEHFGRLHDVMADGVGIPQDGNHYTVGPMLTFDPQAEQHTGEHAQAANVLLKDNNRPGYEIPTVANV